MFAYAANGFTLLDPPMAGGFGVVYKALSKADPTTFFAVKFAREPTNPEHVRRLRKEAAALARHSDIDTIVKLVADGTDGEYPHIVLEYVDGGTLESAIRAGAFNYSLMPAMISDVAFALENLHDRGAFHRDITPRNVMLSKAGRFVLMDLGLAGDPAVHSSFTQAGHGTPGFIDPQVARGVTQHTSASDIYGFGVTVAMAATGQTAKSLHGTAADGSIRLTADQVRVSGVPDEGHVEAIRKLVRSMTQPIAELRPTAAIVR